MNSSQQRGVMVEESELKFQQTSESITNNIKNISQNVSVMTKMVNQFQTDDPEKFQFQLISIQNRTQSLVKETSALLTQLVKLPVNKPTQKLMREKLSDEYMTILNSFQAVQKTVAQKTKEEMKKARAASVKLQGPLSTISSKRNSEQSIELDNQRIRMQEQILIDNERETEELEQRQRAVEQIENDIVDVNRIFTELGTMIHEQDAVVDSIEYHVELGAQNVESATQELRQASTYKNALRRKKVYIAIIVAIIVTILIIILARN